MQGVWDKAGILTSAFHLSKEYIWSTYGICTPNKTHIFVEALATNACASNQHCGYNVTERKAQGGVAAKETRSNFGTWPNVTRTGIALHTWCKRAPQTLPTELSLHSTVFLGISVWLNFTSLDAGSLSVETKIDTVVSISGILQALWTYKYRYILLYRSQLEVFARITILRLKSWFWPSESWFWASVFKNWEILFWLHNSCACYVVTGACHDSGTGYC